MKEIGILPRDTRMPLGRGRSAGRRRNRGARFLLCFTWMALLLLGFSHRVGHAQENSPTDHLYILNFDAWGELQNPGERDSAIEQMSRDRGIERVIIMSYGWGNDGPASSLSPSGVPQSRHPPRSC